MAEVIMRPGVFSVGGKNPALEAYRLGQQQRQQMTEFGQRAQLLRAQIEMDKQKMELQRGLKELELSEAYRRMEKQMEQERKLERERTERETMQYERRMALERAGMSQSERQHTERMTARAQQHKETMARLEAQGWKPGNVQEALMMQVAKTLATKAADPFADRESRQQAGAMLEEIMLRLAPPEQGQLGQMQQQLMEQQALIEALKGRSLMGRIFNVMPGQRPDVSPPAGGP